MDVAAPRPGLCFLEQLRPLPAQPLDGLLAARVRESAQPDDECLAGRGVGAAVELAGQYLVGDDEPLRFASALARGPRRSGAGRWRERVEVVCWQIQFRPWDAWDGFKPVLFRLFTLHPP